MFFYRTPLIGWAASNIAAEIVSVAEHDYFPTPAETPAKTRSTNVKLS